MEAKYAIVTAGRGFLYEGPGDESGFCGKELADELLSGWAVEILEEDSGGWLRVRSFYGYEGWLFGKAVRRISGNELRRRQDKSAFRMIGARTADLLSEPKVQGTIRETLLQDSIVEILPDEKSGCEAETAEAPQTSAAKAPEEEGACGWKKIRAASGEEGWVFFSALKDRQDDDRFLITGDAGSFLAMAEEAKKGREEEELRSAVIRSAFSYEGSQYRWGGKSPSGIDCSGLVFMSYLEQGILLYRDAGIREPFPVREIPAEELKKGDLIFFPGHVALSLGGARFIHATGFAGTPRVTVNSLSPADPDFRPDLRDKVTVCGSVFSGKDSGEEEKQGRN